MTIRTKHTKNPLVLGFGLTAGLGIILMILALAFGVAAGADADSSLISLLFVSGIALFVLGLVAWFFVAMHILGWLEAFIGVLDSIAVTAAKKGSA